jgi:hypothetical protein
MSLNPINYYNPIISTDQNIISALISNKHSTRRKRKKKQNNIVKITRTTYVMSPRRT